MINKTKFSSMIFAGLTSAAAHAQGIPVIDVAALTQAINQVLAWEQQYNQMIQQINQLQQQTQTATRQLSALTGSRGLGTIVNQIPQSVVDPFFNVQLKAAQTPQAANDLAAEQIRKLTQATGQRFSQIQQLMVAINVTDDSKSINELNARIQAEQAMIANELKEASLVQQSLDQQLRAIAAERVQRSIARDTQPVRTR